MTKTAMRRDIDSEISKKLLLSEASTWAIVKHVHANHKFQLVECFVVALVCGLVIGRSL